MGNSLHTRSRVPHEVRRSDWHPGQLDVMPTGLTVTWYSVSDTRRAVPGTAKGSGCWRTWSGPLHAFKEVIAVNRTSIAAKRLGKLMQDDQGGSTLIHWEERTLRLAVHLEVALFHAAVLAVVHPVRALRGLAEIDAVMPRERFDARSYSGQKIGDVMDDGWPAMPIPRILPTLFVKLQRFVSGWQDEAVDAYVFAALPAPLGGPGNEIAA